MKSKLIQRQTNFRLGAVPLRRLGMPWVHLRAVYCAPMRGMHKRASGAKHGEYFDLLRSWRWPRGAKLHEQLDCIRTHVREEPKAAEALDRILGTKNNDLSHEYYLMGLVQAVVVGARPSRAEYEKRLMVNTGKTLKSARDFPARIEQWATEMENMNANPFFCFANNDGLPIAMKRRAKFLAGRVEELKAMPRLYTKPILYLTFTVKEWTGGYHDPEVAELLSAAAAALGKDRAYNAYTLAQARLRFKHAAAKNLASGFTGMR
jgi:hypothetical protein